jgi:hypothetical protein
VTEQRFTPRRVDNAGREPFPTRPRHAEVKGHELHTPLHAPRQQHRFIGIMQDEGDGRTRQKPDDHITHVVSIETLSGPVQGVHTQHNSSASISFRSVGTGKGGGDIVPHVGCAPKQAVRGYFE